MSTMTETTGERGTNQTERSDDEAGVSDGGLSWDQVFELLSTERRRLALERVARSRGPVDVQDVVDFVVKHQTKDPGETSRKATYVALHQVHIPKLADYDVVVWDQDDGKIYLGENGPQVVDAMRRTVRRDDDSASLGERLRDWF